MVEYEVLPLFPDDMPVNTVVWIAPQAAERLNAFLEDCDERDEFGETQFDAKLADHAANGFWSAESHTNEIRDEWGGVKRFGRRYTQFRLIGFYEPGVRKKKSFVVMEAFTKGKGNYTKRERDRVNRVVSIKKEIESGRAFLKK